MNRLNPAAGGSMRSRFLATLLLVLPVAVGGHELSEKVPNPGYRPDSEYMAEFLDTLDSATIAVLPSIVHRKGRSVTWPAWQQQLVDELNEHGIGHSTAVRRRLDRDVALANSQWQIFETTRDALSEMLRRSPVDADYVVLLEILAPGGDSVFGIELYILDRQGRNAFSFLLNSHHQVFVDANLVAADTSEAARTAMIAAATRLAVSALVAQIDQARECIARSAIAPVKPDPGVLNDFESALESGMDSNGIPLGFVTFGDDKTDAEISVSSEYPPRPGDADQNRVLQLDLDVTGWGGMARTFTNPALDEWTPLDWSEFDGFSLWLYGRASGAKLYVHIMDNRHRCSTMEDAERYGVEFIDDFTGWQRLDFRFADLSRSEVFNGAPDDGLGLTHVHGWAIGSGATKGPLKLYVDDFALWKGEPD